MAEPNKASQQDLDATRAKLLDAGAAVFAEFGFRNATVRDICTRAGVNVAAVNYHFRDKLGLYSEILKAAACNTQEAEITAAMQADRSPEDALRLFVRAFFAKLAARDETTHNHIKLMVQELADPSPGLDVVVETLFRPRYKLLCGLVSRLINRAPTDKATRLCVHSLLGQVTHYFHARAVITRVWPELRMTPEQSDEISDHIVCFTLAGFEALARKSALKPRLRREKAISK